MDFAKAFDKVNHSLLVHKIHQYGIRGKVNGWIKSWLSGRNQTVVVEGVNSSQVDVDSGILQGSVLGPSLFIYYINDLQDRLRSTVRLFADDTIAYLTITSEDDAEHLQEDLDKLEQWGEDWFMQFHPAKCTVHTITNKWNPIVTEYTIRGQLLAAVTSAKYLGVTDKVNWSQHIDSITNKANRTLGFLCRNLKISSISIKEQAYKTLVCPLVEYASPVWDPHHQTDIRKLESVQQRAARFILSSQHNRSSVTAMIQCLGWRSLEDRRRDARLTMLYKIDRELVAISKTDRLDKPTRRLRQSHDNAYQVPCCRIDIRKMSFFPRTVRDWNALPPDKASLNTLKASICVQ
jgi:hypothetical protein